ncbi:MAG TPA: ABC transporter ATP-binding protein [Candidatus Kapabacteria bacterium]|jgi:ABC-2 type transport system ATP-binding protein|nr:ABC transporter ATP-binding protein [Candidatus Kapabacteria bacterium]
MTPTIQIHGLEKIYRGSRREPSVHALKPIELEIAPGEVFGLLGPNGAGKTTLIKMLLGIVHPTSGSASILERPIGTPSSKERVGYLPENHRYPAYLSGGGVLRYFGKLSGIDNTELKQRMSSLLELVQMTRWRTTRMKKYSKGMMQRIGLAQALLNDPRVIFLDEPTDGVDPVGRKEIRDIIAHLRDEGRTVFLNSHLLSEVEMVCDRVAILNRGELVRIGTVRELTEAQSSYRIEVAEGQEDRLRALLGTLSIETNGESLVRPASLEELNGLVDRVRAEGLLIRAVTPARQTLEELFFDTITGGGGH